MSRLLLRWREPQDNMIGIGNEHVECSASALTHEKSVAESGILVELCRRIDCFCVRGCRYKRMRKVGERAEHAGAARVQLATSFRPSGSNEDADLLLKT
jgi:hypothetical protein